MEEGEMLTETAMATSERLSPIPYVFVVGCPRSGTTLLQRMLDNHPELAVANDSHFIPRSISGAAVGRDPPLNPALFERVRNYRRFHKLGLSDDAVREAAAGAGTYREFVSALYAQFGKAQGKRLAGEKTPDYVRHLPVLHALFPWVRTVHIIRDGRDVALSVLQWATRERKGPRGPAKLELWRDEPVAACALWWTWQVGAGRRDGSKLGPSHYQEVLYEDLVARPEEALRRIADFLELANAPEMLAYHAGKRRHRPGLSAKKAWLPPTPGLRDWCSAMAERDLELFEALAGDLLSELGYGRGAPTISPEIAVVAERCRTRWQGEMARRDVNGRLKR
jgi:hypothetical protein